MKNNIAQLDQKFVWHPFTQMKDWLRHEPIVIRSGQGAVLRDTRGRKYLDANSSIWTNLHGHQNKKINAALRRQLGKIAHSSALGLANEPAALLAQKLVHTANEKRPGISIAARQPRLEKVFFSDDGSTAVEVALKLAYEFARRTGRSRQPKFISLDSAYHGDTIGAVSLGHIDLFHKNFAGLLFKSDKVAAPYCYRCPHNRAKPARTDARESRKCNWECLDEFEQKFVAQRKRSHPYAAFVVEPLMQGAAGMIPQPRGWLRRATEIVRGHGAQLIIDEVLTGFGRAGLPAENSRREASKQSSTLFACQHEEVRPDFLALAKGLTGGYLPMAATLTTREVFDAFLGEYEEFKTFFHGHSYSANQLGSAAGLASLEILRSTPSVRARRRLEEDLAAELATLWAFPNVGDVRQVGLMAGVELVRDWKTRRSFDLRERAGIRVCEAMARRGVLTRPVGNVIVIMPPYCTTIAQLKKIFSVLRGALQEIFGGAARDAALLDRR
jgi:adenosylmethionine-8-amino-7-oxononanoate aminotransferase